MILIQSSLQLAFALASPIDRDLKRLLALRCDQLTDNGAYDLSAIATFVIAQAGDDVPTIEAAAGVAIATNLVDGVRFGDPGFTTNFEFVDRHGRYLEAVMVLSDDGYGISLWAPDDPSTDPDLLALLHAA